MSAPVYSGSIGRSLGYAILGILFALGLSAVIVLKSSVVYAQTNIDPERVNVTLAPGACATQTIAITTNPAITPPAALDIVLLIDMTSSMEETIDGVRRNAEQIAADTRNRVPDVRFALATFADYQSLTAAAGDVPWLLDQDFTPDIGALQAALGKITLRNGGDQQESYLRALDETRALKWRPNARQLVLLFGDSTPRDPDPGSDETLGTSDDLTQAQVLNDLAAAHITVQALFTDESIRSFYDSVAEQTGGQSFQIEHSDAVAEAVGQLMSRSVQQIGLLQLRSSPPGDQWITWEPPAHQRVGPAERREFAARICAPGDATPGDHEFEITALGDGAILGHIPVVVHVSNSLLPPWWAWLLLIPLLVLGVWLVRRGRGRRGPPSAPPPTRSIDPFTTRTRPPKRPPGGKDVTHGRREPPPSR